MRSLVFAVWALASCALAQVTPIRTYNGIGLPLEARSNAGELVLLEAGTARELARAKTEGGTVDLAHLFRVLVQNKDPKVVYVQFESQGRKRGPALVLQPMRSPAIAKLAADGRTVEFVPDEEPVFSGYRAYVDQNLIFETTFGNIEFRLRPDAAPNTAWTIMELVRGGFYRQVPWHRIVAKRPDGSPFVIQAGDPTGTGSGGPGFNYDLEESSLPHAFGVISVARTADPNTNGSQIFVGLSREGTKHLDRRYAAFGEAVKGAEVILKLAAVPVGEGDRPKEMPFIKRARLVNAPPYGTSKPLARP